MARYAERTERMFGFVAMDDGVGEERTHRANKQEQRNTGLSHSPLTPTLSQREREILGLHLDFSIVFTVYIETVYIVRF